MINRVGIEKIGVYPCSLALRMSDVCQARGQEPAVVLDALMADERSINPLWEDPVTMAVNAANAVLTDEDRRRIELLIVATESGVDYEKPLSTWIHRYLELPPNCRNFEVKHACYGGTAGLQMAVGWLASGLAGDAKALVISADQSRAHLGKPWEFILGAGSAAALISNQPRILELEPGSYGYWTNEVSDLTRPTGRVEVGNSETSLVSYMEALEGAFDHFVQRRPDAEDYDGYFQRHVYHMPFGGIAWRAHRTLLRQAAPISSREAWTNFERKGLAALRYVRRMGATHSASPLIGLLGLIDGTPDLKPGERVSIFSYGSGCCAEFYSGLICPGARDAAGEARVSELLDGRRQVSVEEYEALEQQRTDYIDRGDYEVSTENPDGWYERFYRGKRLLRFTGMTGFYRQYAWC